MIQEQMDYSKKSNKIRDIVRLQQILKKWRKQATLSKSNSSKSINFLKSTLSISERDNSAGPSNAVPKGYLAVCVGEELKRFVIPTEYLGHPAFHVLLREAEEEFGFQQAGVLRFPCEVAIFETVLKLVEEKKQLQDCRLSGVNNIASPLCSSTPSQSPLCR